MCFCLDLCFCFFFFNDTATTEIYTLSLHDALPIWWRVSGLSGEWTETKSDSRSKDRKSTRLNSSHDQISYAVFCLKKKKINKDPKLKKKKKNKKIKEQKKKEQK